MKPAFKHRAALLIIAGMFLLPLVLAWLMYSGAIDYRPGSSRNFGRLVRPPIPISWNSVSIVQAAASPPVDQDLRSDPAEVFAEHWVILYSVPAACEADCLQAVSGVRQVHRASGRHQSRIRMALLLPNGFSAESESELRSVYDQFRLIRTSGPEIRNALERAAKNGSSATSAAGTAYLIDPLGNIMMVYDAGADPNFLKQDLKRLLTWSKLDEQ